MIEYTAKRSLATGHVANARYRLQVEVSEFDFEVRDVKDDQRSAAGLMETSFERQDIFWTITLAPVAGLDVLLLREFLDSTESGETFKVWLTDADAAPLILKREESGHAERSFMRTGDAAKDSFFAIFTALQAAPFDITGLQPGGEDLGGFEGGDSDPTDVYDPEEGGSGGGLDPEVEGLTAAAFATDTPEDAIGFAFDNSGTTYSSVGLEVGPMNWSTIADSTGAGSVTPGHITLPGTAELVFAGDVDGIGFVVGIVDTAGSLASNFIASFQINGSTYLTASADSTDGYYTGLGYDMRWWQWNTPAGLAAATTYPVVIT